MNRQITIRAIGAMIYCTTVSRGKDRTSAAKPAIERPSSGFSRAAFVVDDKLACESVLGAMVLSYWDFVGAGRGISKFGSECSDIGTLRKHNTIY